MDEIFSALAGRFQKLTGRMPTLLASAPGRTELGGNHTDHQHGRALAASVELDARCVAAPNDSETITVHSLGHRPCVVRISELEARPAEIGRSTSLVRGMAARMAAMGIPLRGMDVYAENSVPSGGGLSSSAAFEVMLGAAMSAVFTGKSLEPLELAKLGQFAEKEYYGKPCGLLDQTACAVGGAAFMDFRDPTDPQVEKLPFDPQAAGYALVMVRSGAGHAELTDEYTAIPLEMSAAARALGVHTLREAPEDAFYEALPRLRKQLGDRAMLRAMHFYDEDRRSKEEAEALRAGNFPRFLELVKESGRSSWMLLQNVSPIGSKEEQPMALTLALCEKLLEGEGATRIQGGGFAGLAQAYVPLDRLENFTRGIDKLLGQGSALVLRAGVPGSTVEVL